MRYSFVLQTGMRRLLHSGKERPYSEATFSQNSYPIFWKRRIPVYISLIFFIGFRPNIVWIQKRLTGFTDICFDRKKQQDVRFRTAVIL